MSISSRLSLPVPLLLFIVTSVSGDPPARTDCYGDPLPPGAITRFGTLRLRPAETCVLLAFAPDGKTLVSADRSNGVLIWDRATGKRLRQFGVFPGNLRCAAASPDGRLVAMAGDSTSPGWGNLYCVWDIATGKEIRHLREQQQQATIGSVISAIAFSPDGATLASRHFGSTAVKLWELKSGKQVRQLGKLFAPAGGNPQIFTAPNTLAFTADGKLLIAAGEHEDACTWNLATGTAVPYRKPLPKADHHLVNADIQDLALTRAGRLAWFDQKALRLGNIAWQGKPLALFPKSDYFWESRLAVSADGKFLAATLKDGGLHVWDLVADRKVMHDAGARVGTASVLSISPDGKTVAAAVGPAIRLWDIPSGREVPAETGHRGSVGAAALSPDGKTLVTRGDDGAFRLWDAQSGRQRHVQLLPTWGVTPREIAFSPTGATFALTDWKRLYLFEAATGKLRRRLTVPLAAEDAAAVARSLAPRPLLATPPFFASLARQVTRYECVENLIGFSPDGRRLISAHRSGLSLHNPGFLCVWDPATGQQLQRSPIPPWDLRAGSHGGRRFLWRSPEDPEPNFRLRDAGCDKDLSRFRLYLGRMWGLVFLGDGQSLAIPTSPDTDSGKTELTPLIHLIEVHSGQTRRRLLGPVEQIDTLAVSADGRWLASAADGGIRLWDVGLGKEVGRLKGHPAGITTLCFSADGKRLVSGGKDTTAILWDVAALIPPRNKAGAAPLSPPRMEQLWSDLAGADAPRAFNAIVLLTADPSRSVPFLSKRLRPARALDAEQLKGWLADLGSAVFATREQSSRELAALGERVEPILKQALRTPQSLEQGRRIEQLIQRLERQPVGSNQLRELRAVEVLQAIGNTAALRVLETLATGVPDTRLTREAAAAVERLRGRQRFSRADRSP